MTNAAASAGDPTAHILLRTFAIAVQVATVYIPPSNSGLMLEASDIRLYGASNTSESRLESLAFLAALLTTWAGEDEKKFQSYINVSAFLFDPIILLQLWALF